QRGRQLVAQLLQTRIDRQRLLFLLEHFLQSLQLAVALLIEGQQLLALLFVTLIGRRVENLDNLVRQLVDHNRLGAGGGRSAEAAQRMLAVLVLLLDGKRENRSAFAAGRLGELEGGHVIFAELRRNGPA